MSKRSPKTTGTEWLYLSMASFNGSGYADKSSPNNYYQSYLMYKAWKKQPQAVQTAKQFEIEAHSFAEHLCNAAEAGHTPTDKALARFQAFCNRAAML